jgi:hypothetical protein
MVVAQPSWLWGQRASCPLIVVVQRGNAQKTSNAQHPTPNIESICKSPAIAESGMSLTLRALIITGREEMTKEPAGDEEDDAGCSAKL